MLPTPSTTHLTFSNIYPPSEDTFLLLDTLSSPAETSFLHARYPTATVTPLALEIGTGSGVILAFLTAHAHTILGRADLLTIGTDLNRFACLGARDTVERAVGGVGKEGGGDGGLGGKADGQGKRDWVSGIFLDPLLADLSTPLKSQTVDLLIFNPPYVPTPTLPSPPTEAPPAIPSFEQDSHLLSLSYAGGPNGMATTDRLLQQLPDILSPERGVAYILLCEQNRPEEVKKRFKARGEGWDVETVGRSGRAAGWEKLQVLRIWRTGAVDTGPV
ncbi:MAG: S-adenosylmethionine-dependent methyltransferase [Geoglossum umbratile]|nr:MAG: S-adenosylmethionine-dependent methyltransferase [Geoglossum umbratile]